MLAGKRREDPENEWSDLCLLARDMTAEIQAKLLFFIFVDRDQSTEL